MHLQNYFEVGSQSDARAEYVTSLRKLINNPRWLLILSDKFTIFWENDYFYTNLEDIHHQYHFHRNMNTETLKQCQYFYQYSSSHEYFWHLVFTSKRKAFFFCAYVIPKKGPKRTYMYDTIVTKDVQITCIHSISFLESSSRNSLPQLQKKCGRNAQFDSILDVFYLNAPPRHCYPKWKIWVVKINYHFLKGAKVGKKHSND